MPTASELLERLRTPGKAPFEEVYEIFASPDRKALVQLRNTIDDLEKKDPYSFVVPSKRLSATLEVAEAVKQRSIINRVFISVRAECRTKRH